MYLKDQQLKLIDHYTRWIKTTKNETHKEYAQKMLEACYREDYKEVFKLIGSKKIVLYSPEKDKTYRSAKHAADAYGCTPSQMISNYKEYGLERISF